VWVLRALPRTLDSLSDEAFALYTDFKRLGPDLADICAPIRERARQPQRGTGQSMPD